MFSKVDCITNKFLDMKLVLDDFGTSVDFIALVEVNPKHFKWTEREKRRILLFYVYGLSITDVVFNFILITVATFISGC